VVQVRPLEESNNKKPVGKNMNHPLVSVVIPTYNRADLLLETLEGVFKQTLNDFEVIVVNDGSTDNTLERLSPLQRQYESKFRIVTQPNCGVGVARNRGLEEAAGKYVALLDHDDLWKPDKLRIQVKFLESHPECVAAGTLLSKSTQPDKPQFQLSDVADARGIVARPLWHMASGRGVIQTSTLMLNRELATGIHYGTERRSIEDAQFNIKLMGRGSYGIAGTEILTIYRIHAENASKDPLFYYLGIKQLRRMQQMGVFQELSPDQRRDMELWLGRLGRVAATQQLKISRRMYGVELYFREFAYQIKLRRWQFLLIFPFMFLVPKNWIAAMYQRKFAREKRNLESKTLQHTQS
jgi:glycosyltransferase involved in cell wall biosynthesis